MEEKIYEEFVDSVYNKINELRQKRPNQSAKSESLSQQRRSSRLVARESVALDNTDNVIENLGKILGDDDWDHELVYSLENSAVELLSWELNNNKFLDKFKGCRKSKNITGAIVMRTKGLNGLFNSAGIMIKLSEKIVRETPTAVTLEIAHSLTNNSTMIAYANRILILLV